MYVESKKIADQKIKSTLLSKNMTHSPIFINYWLARGCNEQQARLKVIETKYLKEDRRVPLYYVSKIQRQFLCELEEFLGITLEKSKYVNINSHVYCVDSKYKNYIIQFNGTRPHLDNRFYDKTSKTPWGKTFLAKKKEDKEKIKNLSSKYIVIIIWEYDYNNYHQLVFNKIREIINENNPKNKYWSSASFQYECIG